MNRTPFYIKNIYTLPEPFDRFHVVVRGANFALAAHTERNFHIYLILDGILEVKIDSEKISLSKGQVFIIPPGIKHELYTEKGYFQIGFDVKDISDPYHIAENCCNKQSSLEEICSKMNFSKTHLERLVKQEFQCSVMEYVNRLRFVRLCSQLTVTDKTLAQLAEENGFYDSAHLCVFFKKYSGVTPARYRKGKQ